MKYHLWLYLFSYAVNCEWVEITPIKKKLLTDIRQIVQTTTAANHEFIIKTPLLTNDPEITTAVNTLSTSDEALNNSTFEIYGTSTTSQTSQPTVTSQEVSNQYNEYQEEFEEVSAQKNENIYESFVPFLKMIQNNLLNKNYNSRKSKMSILKHLRDHLLINIKERFTSLFKSPKSSTEARGYKDDDSHMDFPSNEGALMTIGFLTFAVFLIKLIIKLVHALKYKQQYYGSTTTSTAASVVFLKRRKRDEDHMEVAKLLQYIEEF